MRFLMPFLFITLLFTFACSNLILKPANFAWPIESVLKVDNTGSVMENRYSFSFNTKGLFYEEMSDSLAYNNKEIHIIRNSDGYYFVTSNTFKNVYVFTAVDGSMKLYEKIHISDSGLNNPAFNQREPYIELLEGGKSFYLSDSAIIRTTK